MWNTDIPVSKLQQNNGIFRNYICVLYNHSVDEGAFTSILKMLILHMLQKTFRCCKYHQWSSRHFENRDQSNQLFTLTSFFLNFNGDLRKHTVRKNNLAILKKRFFVILMNWKFWLKKQHFTRTEKTKYALM